MMLAGTKLMNYVTNVISNANDINCSPDQLYSCFNHYKINEDG